MATSCEKDGEAQDPGLQHDMTEVTGPSGAAVWQGVAFAVDYFSSDGCRIVQRFREKRNGNVIIVRAYGTVDPNAVCTQDARTRTARFMYTPSATGTLEFRFTNRDGTYISKTLTVN